MYLMFIYSLDLTCRVVSSMNQTSDDGSIYLGKVFFDLINDKVMGNG